MPVWFLAWARLLRLCWRNSTGALKESSAICARVVKLVEHFWAAPGGKNNWAKNEMNTQERQYKRCREVASSSHCLYLPFYILGLAHAWYSKKGLTELLTVKSIYTYYNYWYTWFYFFLIFMLSFYVVFSMLFPFFFLNTSHHFFLSTSLEVILNILI